MSPRQGGPRRRTSSAQRHRLRQGFADQSDAAAEWLRSPEGHEASKQAGIRKAKQKKKRSKR